MVKRDQWEKRLKENKPKVLFLTARHPIQRLISVWNRRFCYGTCSTDQDRKYAKQSLEVNYGAWFNCNFGIGVRKCSWKSPR